MAEAQSDSRDPRKQEVEPPFPKQRQAFPGLEARMDPAPDYGERSYRGSGKLTGRAALVTSGDSGIGRAVALAFAREGADLVVSYLEEHRDAEETARVVRAAGWGLPTGISPVLRPTAARRGPKRVFRRLSAPAWWATAQT